MIHLTIPGWSLIIPITIPAWALRILLTIPGWALMIPFSHPWMSLDDPFNHPWRGSDDPFNNPWRSSALNSNNLLSVVCTCIHVHIPELLSCQDGGKPVITATVLINDFLLATTPENRYSSRRWSIRNFFNFLKRSKPIKLWLQITLDQNERVS